MVEDNKNKGLFLGIAAGAAIVGAALLYHFVFSDDGDEAADSGALLAELEAAGLDKVKKAPNG